MHRSALFFLLPILGLAACTGDEPGETKPTPPPGVQADPILQAGTISLPPEPKRDPVAAKKRLEKLKKTLKKQTAAAFIEAAKSAFDQQNFKEARDAYRGLFLHHPHHKKSPHAVQMATESSFKLGEYSEGLEFFEDSVELVRGRVAEARLLRLLGNTYLAVPHWGTQKGGELLRARYDQGIYKYLYRSDRRTAIRRLEAARRAYATITSSTSKYAEEIGEPPPKARAKLERERIEAQFDLVTALTKFSPFDAGWGYWYYGWDDIDDDKVDEHGADEQPSSRYRGYDMLYRAQPRGVPVDPHGEVVFTERPKRYVENLDTTAKIKFLLHEIRGLDPSQDKQFAARALYQQALLFEARHGASRLVRLGQWWWMGKRPYQATVDETPLYELDDDQVLGLIATHIGRYRVPKDESTIALLDEVIDRYPNAPVAHDAAIKRGVFFQSRQQYARALAAYHGYLEKHPKGRLVSEARRWVEVIERPEAIVRQTGVMAAGTNARMGVEHRNVETLYAVAQRTDPRAAVERFKKAWMDQKGTNYQPSSIPYRLYHDETLVKATAVGDPRKFELTVPDDRTHRFAKSDLDLPFDEDGLWVVTLFKDAERKHRLGRGIVMLTTTAIVEKGNKKGPFAWVVDARTGKPIANAKVEIFDYWNRYEKNRSIYEHSVETRTTDRDGMVQLTRRHRSRVMSVERDGHFSFVTEGFYWYYSPTRFSDADVGVVMTDRPVYRPKDKVKMRAWARRRSNGVYLPATNVKKLQLRIHDPKGAQAYTAYAVATGAGGADFAYELPDDAPLGLYNIQVYADGRYVTTVSKFRVEEYKAPELEVDVSMGDGPARLGEKIPVEITATYLFGGGVSGAKVRYKVFRTDYDHKWVAPGPWDWLYGPGYGRCYYAYPWFAWWGEWGPRPWVWYPWWGPAPEPRRELIREGEGRLDADGKLAVEIDTTRAKELYGDHDQRFTVEAEVTDLSRRVIQGGGEIIATRHAFFVSMEADRGYYRPGETVSLSARALRYGGEAVKNREGRFVVSAVRFTGDNGDQVVERPIFDEDATTDETGFASVKWDVEDPGQYRLSFIAKDQRGEEVVGSTLVWVWGPKVDTRTFKFNHLEVITDKRTYAVGETARLLISSNVAGAHVLFSDFVDGGAMEKPRVIQLQGKTTVVDVPITKRHVPNFFVEAVVVGEGKLSEEVREIIVPPPAAELDIELKPSAAEYRAGKPGRLEVITKKPDGTPVAADVAISVFDRSVLYIQPELTPDVRKVFWGMKRSHRASSSSSLKLRVGPFEHKYRPDQQAHHAFGRAQAQLGAEGSGRGGGAIGGLRGSLDDAADLKAPAAAQPAAKEEALAADEAEAPAESRRELGKKNKLKLDVGDKDRRLAEDTERNDGNSGDGGGDTAAARVRKNFADTATWKVVKTNAKGRASIRWDFPDNLTTWRIKAIGLTNDTRVGQASASVVTTKKLLVQLQAPRFFRERDRVAITAIVHNRLAEDQDVEVKLDVTETLLHAEGDKSKKIRVKAGDKQRVDFWVTVHGEGEAKVRVSALTSVESDAKELRFPVLVHGTTKTDSAVGSIPFGSGVAEKSLTIEVPDARRIESTELVIRTAPSLATAMMDALPFLLEYPYGCTEQTMSRFVPAVITRKTLQQAGGLSLEELAKIKESLNPQALNAKGKAYDERKARDYARFRNDPVFDDKKMASMIRAGLTRVGKLQKSDGGWGWWGSDSSSVYTTAYVLWGLAEARDADLAVPASMVNRGVSYLVRQIPGHLRHYKEHEWISDTDAYFAYVLSRYGKKNDDLLKYLFERRQKLSVYGKSLLALALWNVADKDDARLVLRNAAQFMKEDKENETAWLETNQNYWWYWWNSDIESNATFLRAMMTIRPDDPSAPKIIKWLLNNRKNATYWRSTRDTAIVVSSFGHYLRAKRVSDTNYDLEILIDGNVVKTVHIDRTNLLTFDGEVRLKGKDVPSGKHTITFRRKGKGAVYFNTYLTYFTLEEDVPASGLEIKVERRYFKLVRDDREHKIHDQRGQQQAMKEVAYKKVELSTGDHVDSGDLILVQLEIESKNDYTFLAFEDPKPAGMEPVALRSGVTYGEAVANMELRDEKVVFFLRHLAQGKLHLDYRLRAEIPGTFHAMPTRGFAMYAPELRANSSEIRVEVRDVGE